VKSIEGRPNIVGRGGSEKGKAGESSNRKPGSVSGSAKSPLFEAEVAQHANETSDTSGSDAPGSIWGVDKKSYE